MPYEKLFQTYPYKALICDCENPEIKSWEYHLIGNEVPRVLPGTSFTCKCGGYIEGKYSYPRKSGIG